MKRLGWSISVFGCENEVVVLVEQRLKRKPVESRVGAFPEVLSVADRGSEGLCGGGEQWVGSGPTPGEFGDDGSMFIK